MRTLSVCEVLAPIPSAGKTDAPVARREVLLGSRVLDEQAQGSGFSSHSGLFA